MQNLFDKKREVKPKHEVQKLKTQHKTTLKAELKMDKGYALLCQRLINHIGKK